MPRPPMLNNFVSEADQFLQAFDRQHSVLSKTQQQEYDKHRALSHLRDVTTATKPRLYTKAKKIWEGF